MLGPRTRQIATTALVIAFIATAAPVTNEVIRDFSPVGEAAACHPTSSNHHIRNQTTTDAPNPCLARTSSEIDLQIDFNVCKPHCGGPEMASLAPYPTFFKLDGGNGSWPERTGDVILIRFNITNGARVSQLATDPNEAWDFYVTVRDLDGIVVNSVNSEAFKVNGTVAGQQSGCDNERFLSLVGTNNSRCFIKSLRGGDRRTIEMRYTLATPEDKVGVHRIQVHVDAGLDVCEAGEVATVGGQPNCGVDDIDDDDPTSPSNNLKYAGIVVGKKPDLGIVSIGGSAWQTYSAGGGACTDSTPAATTRQVPSDDLYSHYTPYCTFFRDTYVVNWGDFPTVFANSTVDKDTGTILANTSWVAVPIYVNTTCTGVQSGTSPRAFCNKKIPIITNKWMEPRILDVGADFSGNRSASYGLNTNIPPLDLATAAGTFTVGFQIDADKYLPAPTPENDTTSREIAVKGADITASVLGLKATPYGATEPISFTVKVSNLGDWPAGGEQSRTNSSSAKFTMTVWRDSKDSTALSPTPWTVSKLGAANGTADNEASLLFNNLTASAIGGGSHKIIVELDTSDIVAETNETNTYEFPFVVTDLVAPTVENGYRLDAETLFPALNYTEPRYPNNNTIVYCYNDVNANPPELCKSWDAPANKKSYVRINASVTDNDLNLASVQVNLTVGGNSTLHNMTRCTAVLCPGATSTSSNYFLNQSYDVKGTYTYKVVAIDPSGNKGEGPARSFKIVSFPKILSTSNVEPADRVEFNGTNYFNVTLRIDKSGHNINDVTDPTRVNITFGNATSILFSGPMSINVTCFRDGNAIDCDSPFFNEAVANNVKVVRFFFDTFIAGIDLSDPDTDIGTYTYSMSFTDSLNDTLRIPATNYTVHLQDSIPAALTNTLVRPTGLKAPQTFKINTTVLENVMVRNATILITKAGRTIANATMVRDTSDTTHWLRTATNGSGNYTFTAATGRGTAFAEAGSYTFNITVIDANRTPTYFQANFNLGDDTDPVFDEANVGVTPIRQEINGNVTIYAKATDNTNFTVTARVVNQTTATVTDATLTDDDGDGNYTLELTCANLGVPPPHDYLVTITATDSAGNFENRPTGGYQCVQNLPPLYSGESPKAGGFSNLRPVISVEVRDAANGVQLDSIGMSIQREGGSTTPVNAQKVAITNGYRLSYQVEPSDGFRPRDLVTVTVTAKDLSPVQLQSNFTWTFRVDALAPEITLVLDPKVLQGDSTLISDKTRLNFTAVDLDPPDNVASSGVAFINFTIERGTSVYSDRVNASVASLRLGQLPVFAGEGSYKISYFAADNVGNSGTKKTTNVLVVTTPPSVSSQSTLDGHVTATASSTKDIPIMALTLFAKAGGDAGYTQVLMTKESATTWSADLPVKPKGTLISYYSRAEDELENVGRDRDPTTPNTLRVANHPPKIEILTPKANDTIGATYRVQWTATDVDASDTLTITIDYKATGSAGDYVLLRERLPNSGSASLNTSLLPDGAVELRLRANDGTADGAASVAVTVDNKKPLVQAVSPPSNAQVGVPIVLQASVGKAATAVEARVTRGTEVIVVVQLNDAGTNGDSVAGDGIWGGRLSLDAAGNYKVDFVAQFADGGEGVSTDSVNFTVTGGGSLPPGGSLFTAAMVILAAATVGLAVLGLRRRK